MYEFESGGADSILCDDDKLASDSSSAFISSCRSFLNTTVFGNSTAWPTAILTPSYLVDSDEAPNFAIEVRSVGDLSQG